MLATDSTSAWKLIEAQDPVLVLIDAQLPELAQGLLRQVRHHPRVASLPVVIMSETRVDEDAAYWLNLGADDYMSGYISSQLLKAEVRARLRRAKASVWALAAQ